MKAMELRIGDYVNYRCDALDIHIPVYQVGNGADIQVHENHGYFSPIPLTEEWLLKFGFRVRDDNEYLDIRIRNMLYLAVHLRTLDVILGYNYEWTLPIKTIKYVHQLQNLYFALTGEELTIKS